MRPRKEQSNLTLAFRKFETEPKNSFTAYQIAAFLGINVRNARPYLKILHETGKVYIVGYMKKQNGPAVPLWKFNEFGDNEDAPYPKAKTPAERIKRNRQVKRMLKNANVAIKTRVATCATLRG